MRNSATANVALALTAAVLVVCTDAGLQEIPRNEAAYVDNLLDINGEYCTSPAEEMEFPVKILIVMDQSASLQCTDLDMLRRTAVQRMIEELRANPAVRFGYIGFHAAIFRVDFTTADDFFLQTTDFWESQGPATDYQGALSVVLQALEQDMVNAPISLRARTKYVVMFVSDGVPEPRCDPGCEDNDSNCSDGDDNDGDGAVDGGDEDCVDTMPDNLYGVCNTDEEIPEDRYVDMRTICPQYNMEPQILRKVDDIMALAEAYGVGDLRVHTVFLFAPQAVVDARCGGSGAQFGYVRDQAMPLMQAMADAGEGTFREVNTAIDGEGSFLHVDYQPLESTFDLMETIAVNMNTVPGDEAQLVDSDQDGVDDEREFANGLERLRRDSDNDGYGDLFELRNEEAGFDPADGNRPRECCPTYGQAGSCCTAPGVCTCLVPDLSPGELEDRDGDRLNAAEERFLGTDERDPDTDGDRIPDGLEFKLSIDPTEPDALIDHDFDGIRTRDEVRAATNPQIADAEREASSGVRYSIADIGEDWAERHCYSFEANGIELGITLDQMGVDGEQDPVSRGRNRIYLMMTEEPVELAGHRGNLFLGCVEATYLGESYKDPPSGVVDLVAVRDACYSTCMTCDPRESLDECRSRCMRTDPTVCQRCDEDCNLFYESEIFIPEVHCVSAMCADPVVWGTGTYAGSSYFMCLDNCESDTWCNCNCAYDCDCNHYRNERCSALRACGRL